jgi:flagellar basal body rod protein FlgC
MSEFDILSSASAGMEAQRAALDVAARNVAAAQADPGAFARLVPRFAYADAPADADEPRFPEPAPAFFNDDDVDDGDDADAAPEPPIRYLGTTAERGTDPDAITEMVAVLDAQRAYEADAAIFDAGKRLAERTIEAGRS